MAKPGDKVLWRHQPRGGWGYIILVPAAVISVGKRRVTIAAELKGGGAKRVTVDPANLVELEASRG